MRLVRTRGVGELLVKGAGMFTRGFLFRGGVVHRDRMTENVKAAYLAPHPTWASRTGILAFPREIPFDRSQRNARLLIEIEAGLKRHFDARPVKVIWAMKDTAFTPDYLDRWTQTFPGAEVVRLSDAGHYLQEDASDEIVSELLSLLSSQDPVARCVSRESWRERARWVPAGGARSTAPTAEGARQFTKSGQVARQPRAKE
jgi:cis-3-alkyl-4-acyloxetan-2-one decarboxylase